MQKGASEAEAKDMANSQMFVVQRLLIRKIKIWSGIRMTKI